MLQACGLTVTVDGNTLCYKLSMKLEGGQCWALLGRNGAGKTSLLHTLAGLRAPAEGYCLLDGERLHRLPARQRARRLGVLLQDDVSRFPATVLETALIGRHPFLGRWEVESEADRQRARAALRQMALAGWEQRAVQSLSGGERRRLDLAVLLTQDPPVMLLDEPLNHLDLAHQVRLLRLLRRLASEQGKAVLMVLHDINLAARFCDRVLLLYGGGEWETGASDVLLEEARLSRLYATPIRRCDGLFAAE